MKKALSMVALATAAWQTPAAMAASQGEILVLLSSETEMALTNGKTLQTGYYLNEFGVPAKALVDAGYELVLASPKGNAPQADPASVTVDYFDGDADAMARIQSFVAQLPGIDDTLSLTEVLQDDLGQYEGVFIPGGHAPLIDLANNPQVGEILRHFHSQQKPTAAICHGPIALLSAQAEPAEYEAALGSEQTPLAQNWIYEGYRMTIFSTPEEQYFESTLEDASLRYYPAFAMQTAGGEMRFADMWQPNVVVDRELITGQNPFSDDLLADKLLDALRTQETR